MTSILASIQVYKSGREIKEAAQARVNLAQITPTYSEELLRQFEVLARNPKDDDRIMLTVEQMVLLGL